MVTGRKPVPTEQRRREGRHRHEPDPEATVIGGRPDEGERLRVPPKLSKQMRAVWRVVIDDLRQGGILDRADLATVEAFAVTLGRAREVREYLDSLRTPDEPYGHLLAPTKTGTQAHPLLSKEIAYLTEARLVGEHLGLSPMARTRLGLDAKGNVKPRSMPGELERKLGPNPRLASLPGGRADL